MKKTGLVFAILSVMLLLAADSFAQPDQRMDRGMAHMRRSPTRILFVLKAHQDELKVTDQQLKQIEGIVFSFEEEQIALRSQAGADRLAVRKLMSDRENIDYAQVKTAFVKAAEHKADMFISRLKLRADVNKVLTPEQQDKLRSLGKDRFENRRDFREGRGFDRHPRIPEHFQERQ